MQFDVAMPTVLFLVTVVATFLSRKVEGKLKTSLEEKEFRTRDTALLVISMGVVVSVIVFIPEMALMALFLFSYSMLLFMFTYIFSDLSKTRATLFCSIFFIFGLALGIAIPFMALPDASGAYGPLAFFSMSGCALAALTYEQTRTHKKERWYLAVFPPALFLSLYAFFNRTAIWFPYILDIYGVVFAILIILYIGSLFTWKATLFFAVALTAVDIFLVLVTGSMISAARSVSALRLPVLIGVPVIPLVSVEGGIQFMSLGLGDFFFAGLLAIQTWKRFDKNSAFISLVAMAISFFIFEALLLNYGPTAFPGTLMIICGWLPIVLLKTLVSRKTAQNPRIQK
jgi:hypothetical protein